MYSNYTSLVKLFKAMTKQAGRWINNHGLLAWALHQEFASLIHFFHSLLDLKPLVDSPQL
jgi:hypothetical protein